MMVMQVTLETSLLCFNLLQSILYICAMETAKYLIDSRNGLQRLDYGDGSFAGLTRPILAQANPLSDIYANTNNVNGNTFNGVGTVEIRFLKDFKFTSTNSVYLDEDRDIFVRNPLVWAVRQLEWCIQYTTQSPLVLQLSAVT